VKLQAKYNGAWRNVAMPSATADMSLPKDECLKRLAARLCTGVNGMRITDGQEVDGRTRVLWLWSPESGWHRPHWYRAAP